MLPQKFLNDLERCLNNALSATAGHYWCDGVLGPEWESDYLPDYVAQSQQIILRAWIDEGFGKRGNSRQSLYNLVLHLGPSTLKSYLQKQQVPNTVVEGLKSKWITIDPVCKIVAVQLP